MEMEKEVKDDAEIIRYIKILQKTFRGINITVDINELRELYKKERFSECIKIIKQALKLPVTLRVYYLGEIVETQNTGIITKQLLSLKNWISFLKNKREKGKRVNIKLRISKKFRSAAAFILIPLKIPLYGTKNFVKLKLNMYIRKRLLNKSLEVFIYAVVHELCHLILFSMGHKLKDSDVATDLAVMCLGFCDIMKIGRKTTGKNLIYQLGYLSDHQFEIAYNFVKKDRK